MKTNSKKSVKKQVINQVANQATEQAQKSLTEKQQAAQEKREWLRSISAEFQAQQKIMELTGAEYIPTINEMLKAYYQKQNNITELNTFDQWKEKGYQVRKGEKAYLFWGKPRKRQQAEQEQDQEQAELIQTIKEDFYPICYLFDIAQCYKLA